MARMTVESCTAKLLEMSGNVAAVARSFDVTRSSVYSFMDDHPELKTVLQEARETMKDNVESRLYADCLKDDPSYQTSRIFFLKTQAKDRGYIEKAEIEHQGPGGGPVMTEVVVEHHSSAKSEPTTGEDGGGETPAGVPSGADAGVAE